MTVSLHPAQIGKSHREYGIPALSVLTLGDIIGGLKGLDLVKMLNDWKTAGQGIRRLNEEIGRR